MRGGEFAGVGGDMLFGGGAAGETFEVTRLGRAVTPVGSSGTAFGVELGAEIEMVRASAPLGDKGFGVEIQVK